MKGNEGYLERRLANAVQQEQCLDQKLQINKDQP